ncbi:MAG TPA: hypothetical protein VFQ53_41365 [Kofleriaceae bacterium]|nr:hypothetical protein [Kofleriaceae bacterium]
MPQSTQSFIYWFDAVPYDPNGGSIDAVIGFGNGPIDAFTDMGPIIRFNADGYVDARNGSSYAAVSPVRYVSGGVYRVGIGVNVNPTPDYVLEAGPPHSYNVYITDQRPETNPYGVTYQIAKDFAFRTEQAALSRVDTIGRYVDSASGAISLCNFDGVQNGEGTFADRTTGWRTTAIQPQSGRFSAEYRAYASMDSDALIGLAATTPTRFSDLAAIVRFNPAGYFDVRDGSSYRYDTFMNWSFATPYWFTVDVDIPAKRYSVSVFDGVNPPVRIATSYAFRTEQQAVTSLDQIAMYVDAPDDGYVVREYLRVSY